MNSQIGHAPYPPVDAPPERPITMTGDSVPGILAERKGQTRRVMTPQPPSPEEVAELGGVGPSFIPWDYDLGLWRPCGSVWTLRKLGWPKADSGIRCPYGQPGDRLWVRETWKPEERETDLVDGVLYRADGAFVPIAPTVEAADLWLKAHGGLYKERPGWRSPRFMPKWAARIWLEVTGVRVERLQELSEEDAQAEGFDAGMNEHSYWTARQAFAVRWDELNARRGYGWEVNPWVWVISFCLLSVMRDHLREEAYV